VVNPLQQVAAALEYLTRTVIKEMGRVYAEPPVGVKTSLRRASLYWPW
jgi:hypothetical protein